MLSKQYIPFPLAESNILEFHKYQDSINYFTKLILGILKQFDCQVSSTHPLISLEAKIYMALSYRLRSLFKSKSVLDTKDLLAINTYIKLAYILLHMFENAVNRNKATSELNRLVSQWLRAFDFSPQEIHASLTISPSGFIREIMQGEFVNLPHISNLDNRKTCGIDFGGAGYRPLIVLLRDILGQLSLLDNLHEIMQCLERKPEPSSCLWFKKEKTIELEDLEAPKAVLYQAQAAKKEELESLLQSFV